MTETHSIDLNCLTNKNAIPPAEISNPIARVKPAADRVAPIVSEMAVGMP